MKKKFIYIICPYFTFRNTNSNLTMYDEKDVLILIAVFIHGFCIFTRLITEIEE